MKTKFQLHISLSLLLVYVLNFGLTIHDVFVDTFSENTFKTQATHKKSDKDSSRYYAYQDFEILGHTPTDFENIEVVNNNFVFLNSSLAINASQTAKNHHYFKAGKLIIPSYNTQTCIFPFHDFI